MGPGKDYDKSKNLCFLFEQCRVSFSIFSGKYRDSCNKLHQVCQLFFSMIVGLGVALGVFKFLKTYKIGQTFKQLHECREHWDNAFQDTLFNASFLL